MKYAAFLRGINVGGRTMVKMERLREIFGGLGFENVKTYINSGNLVFETREADDRKLAGLIRDRLLAELDRDIAVMVRPMAGIEEVIANNPFGGQFDSHKSMHVFFLGDELTTEQEKMLMAQANDSESIAVRGRTIYYLLKVSIVDSVLGKGFIDKKLKVPATARNWRTVQKMAEL